MIDHGIELWQRVRSHRCVILAIGCAAVGLVGLAALGRPIPIVIYNASASAPIGFYQVLPRDPIRCGDLVLAKTPDFVRHLAAERGYLPDNVPLVKRVAALQGDTVCIRDRAVSIDDRHVADQLAVDGRGRSLPAWSGCRRLTSGEFFLLMANVPDSFDGRYFGPVPASAIIGKLAPLWAG